MQTTSLLYKKWMYNVDMDAFFVKSENASNVL